MDDLRASLHRVADLIADYRESLPGRRVVPSARRGEVRQGFDAVLPDGPAPLETVIDELVSAAGARA